MRSSFLSFRAAGAVVVTLAALALAGCSASGATTPSSPPTSTASAAAPTGSRGAVSFDEGTITIGTGTIGSGAKTVDLFVDPMCPYCKLFETTSGPMLLSDAAAGSTTVRVHPLAILNRLSQGTDYSTRAAAVFAAVAAEHPDKAAAFFSALFAHQPAENSPGLSDAELVQLAGNVGADVGGLDIAPYRAWVDQQTKRAVSGPLTVTTQIPSVRSVPTVIVNGSVYDGNSNEIDRFAAFYRAH